MMLQQVKRAEDADEEEERRDRQVVREVFAASGTSRCVKNTAPMRAAISTKDTSSKGSR